MISTYFGFVKNPFARNISTDEMFKWKDFENLSTRFNYFIKEGGIFLLCLKMGTVAVRKQYRVGKNNSAEGFCLFYQSEFLPGFLPE